MTKKNVSLLTNLTVFLSASIRQKLLEDKTSDLNQEETEELAKAKEFFSTENLNSNLEFSVSLENFLWTLLEKIPVPESPLRLKSHERLLQEVASELERTLGTDEIPSVPDAVLKKVVHLVEDPEEFKKLNTNFEFTVGDKKRSMSLPAVNILQNDDFVELLDQIFKNVTSLET